MKKEQSIRGQGKVFSRRRFLAVSSVSAVGVWATSSDQLGARVVRGIVAEAGRSVGKPSHTPDPSLWSDREITAAWLGHSTVLINFFGVKILTDPVLCKRVGADTLAGNIGPKRLVAPALKASQLPNVDVVLLSHAHMDHFDPTTLRALRGNPHVVTAHATTDLLQGVRSASQTALRWDESTRLQLSKSDDDLAIKAFEVNHWGARWRYDKYRGYNGYVLTRNGRSIVFGGDTAMTASFKSLRCQKPYEFAIMPIGAYQPWINAHCTPEQAVQMAQDAGARTILPVHFKTFAFGREGASEPLDRLQRAVDPSRIGWRDVGETFAVSA